MGSVINYVKCHHCNTEDSLYEDYYYKTGEIYMSCNACGYYESHSIKPEAREAKKKLDELTDDDWQHVKIDNPLGAYSIISKKGIGNHGTLEEDAEDEMRRFVAENKDEIESATISKLINGKIVVENILNYMSLEDIKN